MVLEHSSKTWSAVMQFTHCSIHLNGFDRLVMADTVVPFFMVITVHQ